MDTQGEKKQSIIDLEKSIIDHLSKIKDLCDSGIAQIDKGGKSTASDANEVASQLDTIFGEIDTIRDILFDLEEFFDNEE